MSTTRLVAIALVLVAYTPLRAQESVNQFDRLATALLGATPLESDLHDLTCLLYTSDAADE